LTLEAMRRGMNASKLATWLLDAHLLKEITIVVGDVKPSAQ
jgi:hypothetical protein